MVTNDDVIKEIQKNNRVCSQPKKWQELYDLLPSKQRKGSSWETSTTADFGCMVGYVSADYNYTIARTNRIGRCTRLYLYDLRLLMQAARARLASCGRITDVTKTKLIMFC
jgi:hypothetical protein